MHQTCFNSSINIVHELIYISTGNSHLCLQHLQQAHKKLGSTTLVLPKLSEAVAYLSQYQSTYCEAVGRLSGPERSKVRVYTSALIMLLGLILYMLRIL